MSERTGAGPGVRSPNGISTGMADSEDPKSDEKDQAPKGSLVPLYSPLDVSRGIQAYRRGDVILYTVRGEPRKVQELIGELDRRGVSELVALVSHRVTGRDMLGEPQQVADAKADSELEPEAEDGE